MLFMCSVLKAELSETFVSDEFVKKKKKDCLQNIGHQISWRRLNLLSLLFLSRCCPEFDGWEMDRLWTLWGCAVLSIKQWRLWGFQLKSTWVEVDCTEAEAANGRIMQQGQTDRRLGGLGGRLTSWMRTLLQSHFVYRQRLETLPVSSVTLPHYGTTNCQINSSKATDNKKRLFFNI